MYYVEFNVGYLNEHLIVESLEDLEEEFDDFFEEPYDIRVYDEHRNLIFEGSYEELLIFLDK